MNAFLAIIRRDLILAARNGGTTVTLLAFFLSIGVIMPIAIGPDKPLLASLAPAIIWIAALLSTLLGLDRLFLDDHEDGSLQAFSHANASLATLALAKLIAHWLITALPLILATPVLAIMLFMEFPAFLSTIIALFLGTPALVALGALGASVAVTLKRGGVIAPILILPLSVPVLIFGISATNSLAGPNASHSALLFLGAFSLLTMAFAPFAIALALRSAGE
ncbi:MAG TPA: heme exporter protein CcmB [Devosia sp.]|nr:heme exporter protein CcmB [Devosia sp.]